MDSKTYNTILAMHLEKVDLIPVDLLENDELLRVKKNRTVAEYCWTITPRCPSFIFSIDKTVERVTYIDADLWFLSNPNKIFNEFKKSNSVALITKHNYIKDYDQSATSGTFCVQFMIFNRVGTSEILKTWAKQCLEWCYDRFEDGKFGDQKYLDDWPKKYGDKVHILQEKAWAQGPWNASENDFSKAVFYHFHQVKFLTDSLVDLGSYPLLNDYKDSIYRPYLKEIKTYRQRNNLNFQKINLLMIVSSFLKNLARAIFFRPKTNLMWI